MVEIKSPLDPKKLLDEISKKMSELYLGKPISIFIDGREVFSEAVVIQNIQPYVLDFTTFLGKGSGTLYSLVFKYGKFFKVFKIKESLYISPTYNPYYQITIKQKEEIENNIKVQLAQIASAISDTELIAHDYRKYKQFFDIIKKIEELEEKLKKEKDEKIKEEIKKQESLLRSIFIDQVDIHTGDFSIVNLARTRWPTLISDFLQLENEEVAEEVLKKLKNITTAEAILLAKKNKLYLEWKKMFFEAVKERFERIKNLLEMRKFSIESYKEMVRPLIKKWLSYQESIPSKITPWAKPASMAQAVESTTFWMIKPIPFSQYEAEEIYYESKLKNLKELGIKDEEILEKLGVEKNKINEIISKRLPVEPSIDRITLIGLLVLNEHFNLDLNLKDLIEIRNFLIDKTRVRVGEEVWKLSPYYAFFEISLDRTIFKMPDGTELEDVWLQISPYLISQNIAILILIQEKMLDKHVDDIANRFLGEGKKIEIERKESIKNYVIDNCKWFKENYLKFSEFTFIKKFFGIPRILYNKAYADDYFYDYVVQINEDIKRTLFSMFNFPV
jgi:hypothetical protein